MIVALIAAAVMGAIAGVVLGIPAMLANWWAKAELEVRAENRRLEAERRGVSVEEMEIEAGESRRKAFGGFVALICFGPAALAFLMALAG